MITGNTELYADQGWPEIERVHAAKITLLDRQVGRLLNKLQEMGELDNTLVLFTSDNGPHFAALAGRRTARTRSIELGNSTERLVPDAARWWFSPICKNG